MKKKPILIILSLFCMGVWLLFLGEARAEKDSDKRVLFISSYSYTWSTVPLQIKGIQSKLDAAVTLDIEYMNTKSLNDEKSGAMFYEHIKYLMEHVKPYDAVIVGDDAAFQFAAIHREELFTDIPIVFEGVNNIEEAIKAGSSPMVTGVVEEISYTDNIDFALKVNPGAKKIVGIVDDTVTGIGEQQQFLAQEENYSQLEFSLINCSRLSREEIEAEIGNLSKDTILIYLILTEDRAGNYYTNRQAVDLITENSHLPVYRFVQAGIGDGVLGGNIVSHEESGRIAASMVMKILEGTEAGDIPVQLESPNKNLFDYKVIKKYGINSALLPEDTVLINRDMRFWEKYGKVLSVTIGIAVVLMTFLLVGVSALFVRKKNQILVEKNRQLADAVNHADQASKAKSQFLSRMSHEIRTPMNAIVGITTIAKEHLEDSGKMEECLEKVMTSSKILLNIINDVLDMSAIESEKLNIAHAPFDFKELLSAITAVYYPQCRQKGIKFEVRNSVTEERLIGDSLRLNQILLNLISNAYKFTDAGGEIIVKVSETACGNGKVFYRFEVADTGIGMSEDMLRRAFHSFEQEDAGVALKHGGSGLGLSISKNLVELMKGAIQVKSKEGEGTTFLVDIPFEVDVKSAITDAVDFRNIKALIVDDDKSAREYTGIVLRRMGVPFDVASGGEEAVQMLTEASENGEGYDICFVDWKMPGMNGIDVTGKIRKMFDENTIIIIVSAYDLSEIAEEAKEAGADIFVTKPLFQSTVFNVLMSIHGGRYIGNKQEEVHYDFTGYRVLLAEDNELNSEIAIELLGMANLMTVHAEDGQKAVELFENSPVGTYDAILMDIQMPVMDGYEATKKIRASSHPQGAAIPIYAMTANAFTEDVSAALSAGMNGHLAKPIDTELLYRTLYECFSSKGAKNE